MSRNELLLCKCKVENELFVNINEVTATNKWLELAGIGYIPVCMYVPHNGDWSLVGGGSQSMLWKVNEYQTSSCLLSSTVRKGPLGYEEETPIYWFETVTDTRNQEDVLSNVYTDTR